MLAEGEKAGEMLHDTPLTTKRSPLGYKSYPVFLRNFPLNCANLGSFEAENNSRIPSFVKFKSCVIFRLEHHFQQVVVSCCQRIWLDGLRFF